MGAGMKAMTGLNNMDFYSSCSSVSAFAWSSTCQKETKSELLLQHLEETKLALDDNLIMLDTVADVF